MAFTQRINFPHFHPPSKLYVHDSLPENLRGYSSFKHFVKTICSNFDELQLYQWIIGMLWSDNGEVVTDLFAYSGINSEVWPGNPDVSNWVVRQGIYRKDEKILTCGDTLMALGFEEAYRRTTKDFGAYTRSYPSASNAEQIMRNPILGHLALQQTTLAFSLDDLVLDSS